MTSPLKPWESNSLQNSTQIRRCPTNNLRDIPITTRSAPVLPPLPRNSPLVPSSGYNSYMPYSSGYSSYSNLGYGGYGSYGMPYRSPMYNSYGSYGGYNSMYGMGGYPGFGVNDDAERRFIQYAEESSRNTFASVESIVRAVNSISTMLDNTFFAMTSSFRAVLSVADNFGRLRSMFGHIWYSINIFRLFNWLYRKFMWLIGKKVPPSASSLAWRQASGGASGAPAPPPGSSWPTLAFLGVLVSAPYIISKFLPKYEDKCDPVNWKSPGIRAKAAFDFVARTQNELSVQTNDEVTLAPTYIQEEMNLKNSGWAFALSNGRSGVVPLNYLVINKAAPRDNPAEAMPVPRVGNSANKTHTKRVSFGENQIFENVDLEDYVTGKKDIKGVDSCKDEVKNDESEAKVETESQAKNVESG